MEFSTHVVWHSPSCRHGSVTLCHLFANCGD